MTSRIILLNGTSSAGKTTLAGALRPALDPGFCYYSSDQLADAGFRPPDPAARTAGRERFFSGFHRSIAGFAAAGNDMLVEHILEEQSWVDDLKVLLATYDVFWVGVHASLVEIERREQLRGNRTAGEGRFHLKTHAFCRYDLEVDSGQPLEQTVRLIVERWRARTPR